jgi:hypothetical protein
MADWCSRIAIRSDHTPGTTPLIHSPLGGLTQTSKPDTGNNEDPAQDLSQGGHAECLLREELLLTRHPQTTSHAVGRQGHPGAEDHAAVTRPGSTAAVSALLHLPVYVMIDTTEGARSLYWEESKSLSAIRAACAGGRLG